MQIKPALVKELRERTGAGMMDCKNALVETNGDLEAASELLRKSGQAKADKKAGRIAAEGRIVITSGSSGNRYAIVEVNAETDFVANDENFGEFAELVGKVILETRPTDVNSLMEAGSGDGDLEQRRRDLVAKVGENIAVRRFEVLDTDSTVGAYTHMGRIGALVEIEGGDERLARDLAMQVAATRPQYVSTDEVPEETVSKEREILSAQAEAEGKPADIVEKMVEGRLRKHFDEVTLLGQPFVKDPDMRVRDLLAAHGARAKRFIRFEVGEGIERRSDNLGDEVRSLLEE
jgi:elongation factor Ts